MSVVIEVAPARVVPGRKQELAVPSWFPRVSMGLARMLPVLPMLAMMYLIVAAGLGVGGALVDLREAAPALLGNAALFSLAASFAVTPVGTVTGWRWHQILRRDFGLWTFAFAALDLTLAATVSPEGWRAGVAGQAFLAAGTAATLLLVPLAVTSNRWSMRRFGSDWKLLHKLVYVVLVLVALHLVLLPSGPQELALFIVLIGPSLALRVPRVRRRVIQLRGGLLARLATPRSEA